MNSGIVNSAQSINWANNLNNGLISRWQNMPYGVGGGGTVFRDLVRKNSNHGTLTNMALPSTAMSGWGPTTRKGGFGELRFDAANDMVNLGEPASTPGLAAMQIGNNFSYVAWVKTTAVAQQAIFSSYFFVGNDNGPLFRMVAAGVLSFYDDVEWLAGTTAINDGKWHRVGFADYSSTNHRLFVDGKEDASNSSSRTSTYNSNADFIIGAADYSSTNNTYWAFWNGSIDDMRVYSLGLSPSWFAQDYINSQRLDDPTLNWIQRRVYSFPAAVAGIVTPSLVHNQSVYRSNFY